MAGLLDETTLGYIGRSAPERREVATRRDIRHYAVATRQTEPRYLAGEEAPPLYYTALFWPEAPLDRLRSDGLTQDLLVPELPLPRVMAGGVRVRFERGIRPGDELIANRKILDIREKQGKTGALIFVDVEMRIETEAGEPVLTEVATTIAR